jgi:hypothetical protein
VEEVAAQQDEVDLIGLRQFEHLAKRRERILFAHGVQLAVAQMVVRADHDAEGVRIGRAGTRSSDERRARGSSRAAAAKNRHDANACERWFTRALDRTTLLPASSRHACSLARPLTRSAATRLSRLSSD